MLTLGIYRFWLNTDIRRFLWGNTEVAGDGLEYTGTARELLIGFLMAIVLLVPINGLIFLGTLAPGLLPFSGALGFVLLALLGQFAYYRARRYRLTRTVYRGVRFHQTGSGWAYSLRANLWLVLIALTLGLAYPWSLANLERYKMRHTHFGNLTGWFEGSGTRLFFRGVLLWIVVVGPLLAGLFGAAATVDWAALATVATAQGADPLKRMLDSNPEFAGAIGLLIGAVIWAILAGALLYPVFRAMITRWWLAGLRMGGVVATSRLRTGQIYKVYARFIGIAMLFSIAASIAGGIAFAFFLQLAKSLPKGDVVEIAGVVFGLVGYVMVMLAYSAIYQGTVTIRLWRLSFETTELSGLEALDTVEARAAASTAFGEGLADALDVGGM
jgi:uncharacterized membrane protein YjgN (DUF898 family)